MCVYIIVLYSSLPRNNHFELLTPHLERHRTYRNRGAETGSIGFFALCWTYLEANDIDTKCSILLYLNYLRGSHKIAKLSSHCNRTQRERPDITYDKWYIDGARHLPSILTWYRSYRDHAGGAPRKRLSHCTSVGLTPAITPNVGNSGTQFICVGVCVRANPCS